MTSDEQIAAWLDSPAGVETVERMARAEHEYEAQFGTPGAVHRCPTPIHALHVESGDPCDGTWIEGEQPSWEDEDEHIRENIYREDARRHLRAALSSPTCAHRECDAGLIYYGTDEHGGAEPCPDCGGSGTSHSEPALVPMSDVPTYTDEEFGAEVLRGDLFHIRAMAAEAEVARLRDGIRAVFDAHPDWQAELVDGAIRDLLRDHLRHGED